MANPIYMTIIEIYVQVTMTMYNIAQRYQTPFCKSTTEYTS